jgi:formiminotetrahydrofolate cyclodeaminase
VSPGAGRIAEATIESFLAAAAARTPVPGGGAGCALIGAVGAAFAAMAVRFTSAPKDSAGSPDPALGTELSAAASAFDAARLELLAFADEDSAAYAGYVAATRLPKATEVERAARATAIESAARDAASVPLRAADAAIAGLRRLAELAPRLNPRLASDVGVGAIALRGCVRGFALNVAANAGALPAAEGKSLLATAQDKIDLALALEDAILLAVKPAFGEIAP